MTAPARAAGGAVDRIIGEAFTAYRLARAGEYRNAIEAEAYVAFIQWHAQTASVQRRRAERAGDAVQAEEWREAFQCCGWAVRALRAEAAR